MPVPAISLAQGVASGDPDRDSLITWRPGWQELDLITGLVVEASGAQTLLDPAAFATLPRNGIQLADVRVLGSAGSDWVVLGACSAAAATAVSPLAPLWWMARPISS